MRFSRSRARVSILPGGGGRSRRVACRLVPLAMSVAAASAHADVTELDDAAFAALIAEGVPVIDVRREDEWRARGVIEGSHLLTFFDAEGRYDVDAWLASLADVAATNEPLVLICAHGIRSKRIADLLDSRLGFTAVHHVTEGIEGWREEDGPVVPPEP